MAEGRRWWQRRNKQEEADGSKAVEFTPALIDSLRLFEGVSESPATLYKTQLSVFVVVDFLARNIAQLNLKTYRRQSSTDRPEVPEHPVAQLIQKPNLLTSRYRLMHETVSDVALYGNAYWLKKRQGSQRQLVRLPPWAVQPFGTSMLVLDGYRLSDGTKLAREDLIHFRNYNPDDPRIGLSPLEPLRMILAEEHAATLHRKYFWQNAARQDGVIERPIEAPRWSEDARKRFRQDWQNALSGRTNAGKTAVLEEGMKFNSSAFSPRDAEFIPGRKFTREEVARAYHIPLPMVGILDHATFSNIKEQHKQLYQDTLGPWLSMFEQELMLKLFPWFTDTEDLYLEFNIEEKLQGSFDEQINALSTAVGPSRAWMSPDEARGKVNLPRRGGPADELGIPLNISVGEAPAAEPEPSALAPGEDTNDDAA